MAASLFEELEAKLAKDPSLLKRGGPRVDLGLLLFNARGAVHGLWKAAEGEVLRGTAGPELAAAVEQLRPLFGARR